jgi:hypothetical protein
LLPTFARLPQIIQQFAMHKSMGNSGQESGSSKIAQLASKQGKHWSPALVLHDLDQEDQEVLLLDRFNSFRTSKKQSRMCFLYSNLCRNSYTILRNPWISWMTLSQDRRISWLTSLWLGCHDSLGWGCRTALHGGWHSEPTNFPWPWAGHRDVGPVEQRVPKYLGKLW